MAHTNTITKTYLSVYDDMKQGSYESSGSCNNLFEQSELTGYNYYTYPYAYFNEDSFYCKPTLNQAGEATDIEKYHRCHFWTSDHYTDERTLGGADWVKYRIYTRYKINDNGTDKYPAFISPGYFCNFKNLIFNDFGPAFYFSNNQLHVTSGLAEIQISRPSNSKLSIKYKYTPAYTYPRTGGTQSDQYTGMPAREADYREVTVYNHDGVAPKRIIILMQAAGGAGGMGVNEPYTGTYYSGGGGGAGGCVCAILNVENYNWSLVCGHPGVPLSNSNKNADNIQLTCSNGNYIYAMGGGGGSGASMDHAGYGGSGGLWGWDRTPSNEFKILYGWTGGYGGGLDSYGGFQAATGTDSHKITLYNDSYVVPDNSYYNLTYGGTTGGNGRAGAGGGSTISDGISESTTSFSYYANTGCGGAALYPTSGAVLYVQSPQGGGRGLVRIWGV